MAQFFLPTRDDMLNLISIQQNIYNYLTGHGTGMYGVDYNIQTDTFTRIDDAAGLTQADFNNIFPWAGMRRCNVADDGRVLAYYGDPTYKEDGSNGQVMVEIPKFYYKSMRTSTGYRWWVSPNPLPGFQVHPAFIRNNVTKQYIYIAAYEGSIYDVSTGAYLLNDEQVADFTTGTGDKLCSIAGAKPCSGLTQNLTLPNSRILAHNRGSNWELQDFLTICAVQLLFIVEYASFDTQGKIGSGATNITDDGSTNMTINTGYTSTLGNNSGSVSVTHYKTGQATNAVSYRGIENLWGNIWQWVDGINIKADHIPYVADHGFQSDLFTDPYKPLNVVLPAVNGYVKDIAYNDVFNYGFLPSNVTGSSSTYLHDYYYQNTGNMVAVLGGAWSFGSHAGAFCWSVSVASGYRHRDVGARLLYIP